MENTSFSNPRFTATPPMILLHVIVPVICFVVAYIFTFPPQVILRDASPSIFSAERAFDHVEAIAQRPHPWGSPEQERVIGYIRDYAQGLKVEVLELDPPPRAFSPAGPPIRNIAARIKGKDSTGAVLLMAHHDSKRMAPGAGDDALGVATLLETMRGIVTVKGARNDIIFLFTDAEEASLQGAKAFVNGNPWDDSDEGHPWLEDVAIVLNFDGRGAAGQAMVTNTGIENGWVVQQLGEATQYPVANSLMVEVTARMPNYSDVIPFEEAGYPVMNFNFADAYPRYHSHLDVPAGVDKGTLQHLGEYALPLALHFGEADLSDVKASPRVYFNPAGYVFVHYPAVLTWPLYILTVILFGGLVFMGIKYGHVSITGMVFGLTVYAITVAIALGAVYGLARVLEIVQPDTFHFVSHLHFACAAALATAVFVPLSAFARVWLRAQDIAMGALFTWIAVGGAVTVMTPGGSAMFVWPALLAIMAMAFHFGSDDFEQVGTGGSLTWMLLTALTVLMFTSGVIALNIAVTPMGTEMMAISVGFIMLLFGLNFPQIAILIDQRPWILPSIALVTANAFFIAALVLAPPRAETAELQARDHAAKYAESVVAKSEGERVLDNNVYDRVKGDLARGERSEALEALFKDREPVDIWRGLESLADEAYSLERDISDYVFLAQQTISFCMAEADRDEVNATAWTARAKAAAYNLGANTWPGWDEPGYTFTDTQIAAGAQAADLNLELAIELDRPADKVAMAHWLVGAHAIAASDWDRATASFDEAIAIQPDDGSAYKLNYEGFAAIARAGSPEAPADARDAVTDAINQLRASEAEFAGEFADQVETAARIYLPEPPASEEEE